MGELVRLWPFAVIGLFSGSVYALAAMGVVLTYRTSGVFNVAYGALAMFCAFTYWQLHDAWHVSAWLSLPAVLGVVAPLSGLVCERLFRRAVHESAELQIVIALGLLAFLQAAVPLLYGGRDRPLSSVFPTDTFRLGRRLFVSWAQVDTVLLTVGLAAVLWLVLRRTRFGRSTEALVDDAELAELAGVSAAAVSRAAWIVSSIFAGLVGILLSSSQGLDTYVLVIVVIYAFAPAVLARLVSLPLAFAGGLALGVIQGVLGRWGSRGAVADLEAGLPYLALFVLLVVLGRRLSEPGARGARSVVIRPVAVRIARPPDARAWPVTAALLVLVGVLAPSVLRGSQLRDVTLGLLYAAVAVTVVVLTGWAGQISLAQFSFVGVGAFAAGHLAGPHGGGFLAASLVGALVAVPVGVLVGLPSLRLSGLYLALATMAFALLLDTLVFVRRWVSGGSTGMTIARPRVFGVSLSGAHSLYYLALGTLTVFAVSAALLQHGRFGRRLQMVRDDPVAAACAGVNLTLTKLVVFAACGAAAAFVGALFGAVRRTVGPFDFSFGASLELLLIVVLCGRSRVSGALLSGGLYAAQLLPMAASIERFVPLGVALGVVVVARHPDGFVGALADGWWRLRAVLWPLPRASEARRPLPAPEAAP